MSRAKIKGNVVTYSIRFLSLIYLIPIYLIYVTIRELGLFFVKSSDYLYSFHSGIMSKIDKAFPFKVGSDDK